MIENKYKTKISEDAAKRFRMLCEYTFNIREDEGEENVNMETPEENCNEISCNIKTEKQHCHHHHHH